MLANPVRQRTPCDGTGGKRQERAFRIIDRDGELVTVEDKKDFEGSMANPLVAIDERVIADERMGEGRRFVSDPGI